MTQKTLEKRKKKQKRLFQKDKKVSKPLKLTKKDKRSKTASSLKDENIEVSLHPYLKELKAPKNGLEMLYGYHAVKEAIKNPKRQIEALVINPKAQGKVKKLYQKLSDSAPHQFDFIEMERQYFNLLTGEDTAHQSIILFVHPLEKWEVSDILDKDKALLLVLDQASDMGNIGAVLRSCAAFGADALILPERYSPQTTANLAKTAVGALEHVPIIRVNNLKSTLEKLKKNDFWIIGCDGQANETIENINISAKTAFIIGSEDEGLRRLTKEACDFLAKIPMGKNMESLNMSVAAAISLYEVSKKMKKL